MIKVILSDFDIKEILFAKTGDEVLLEYKSRVIGSLIYKGITAPERRAVLGISDGPNAISFLFLK